MLPPCESELREEKPTRCIDSFTRKQIMQHADLGEHETSRFITIIFFPPSQSLKMRRISQQLPFRRFVLGLKSCFVNCERERKNPPMGIGTSSYVTRHLFLGFFLFLLFVFLGRRGRKESSVSLTKQPSVYLPDRQAMSTSFSKSVCGEGGTERDKMSNPPDTQKRLRAFFLFRG